MRHIKVKKGRNTYKLMTDDGVKLGEITITYSHESRACSIDIIRLGDDMTSLSIEANLNGG